jgi:UDP-N-acetylmuramate dehydrogenase
VGRFFESFNLKSFHTFRISTSADLFYVPATQDDAKNIVQKAYMESVPVFVLGSGTNLLIRDGGIRGVVLYQGPVWLTQKPKILNRTNNYWDVEFCSRFSKAEALAFAVKNKLGGLEFSAGIPGTLGGAVWMNAGTKWGAYKDVIVEAKVFHPKVGSRVYSVGELGLSYRTHDASIFDEWTLIESVTLRLPVLNESEKVNESLQKINEILLYRGTRQPLELPNCGSVFKNPENSERGAGRLIEASQLKGTRLGGAFVSLEHANFIHNDGSAEASDVEGLVKKIQQVVKDKYGVSLEREVIIVGESRLPSR